MTSKWLQTFKPNPEATTRLFCFHHAGGSSQFFHSWSRLIPSSVEVCAIQLPGRWNRFQEEPFRKMIPLIAECKEAISPLLCEKPYALFGHSLGGLIAFELARNLVNSNVPLPIHLFLSSRRAPQLPRKTPLLCELSESEFEAAIARNYGNLPAEILADATGRKTFFNLIRTDMQILESYEYLPSAPLNIPITVFGGQGDPAINLEDLTPWGEQSSRAFETKLFPGGHFYLKQQEETVTRLVASPLLEPVRESLASMQA